jgi:hypothetical protein
MKNLNETEGLETDAETVEDEEEETWEEVVTNFWKPETDGDSIQGVLLAKKDEVGINKTKAYDLQTKDGVTTIWGTTVLDDRLAVINIGEKIRITYKGTKPSLRGKDVKIFKVDRAI